ncbi:BTAD domain-containing putative transcriptional regulator [Kribbella sp. CA-247076]|uniref:BTAD domain-containing putative transcriptional regulator n=1 Tax=Kribbella sp. CA-247076 TaxID=3239941 RepID=UPI003D8D761C
MYFGVLGPLVVRTDAGEPVAVPDTKVRTLLLDLLVHRGRPVSADRLIEDLWGDRPPRNATGTLQARISQLRTALDRAEPGSRALVAHGPAGYTLTADVVDSNIFEELVDAGRLREALDLWRGPAYADIADHEFARAARDRLEEARLTATETLLEQAEDPIPELTELIRQHPLRERLRALHMRALYRAGRQDEALRSYADLREALAEELGADPGPELVELHAAILRHDASLQPSRLPAPLNDLIGRAEVLTSAKDLLTDTRLLTFVGPGGVGKTRLALELGRSHIGDVRLVELAPLRQDDLLDGLAAAMGLRDDTADLLPRLIESMRARPVLLILDNCEHLQAADITARLLAEAPELRVLATSREPLGLPGERVFEVEPLAPQAAVDLFTARAGVADSEAVRAICRRLDGIPLALELAATRVRALGVEGLADRLDDRFRLLSGGRGVPERQRTLRATIDWSWDLLTADERAMLRRLAVHAGTFSLEAAAEVCELPEAVAMALVDKSLVAASTGRYRLLESVAAYSLERLAEAGEEAATRRRHADYYLRLAQQAEEKLRGPEQRTWLHRLDQEAANFRAALETGPPLKVVNALAWYWYLRGRHGEARRSIAAALAAPGQDPADRAAATVWLVGMAATDAEGANLTEAAEQALASYDEPPARALWFLAHTQWAYGARDVLMQRVDRAIEAFTADGDRWGLAAALSTRAQLNIVHADLWSMLQDGHRSFELFDELGDDWGRLQAAYSLIIVAEISGDYPTAVRYLEDSLRLAEDLGLWTEVSFRTSGLGRIAYLTGDYERADALHERARRLAIEQSNKSAEEYAEVGLGLSARRQGRLDDAEAHFTKWLDWLRQVGGTPGIAFILAQLGFIAEQRGDFAKARALHEQGYEAAQQVGDERAIALALEGLAGATEDPARAHQLLTEAEALRAKVGSPLPPAERFDVDRITSRASRPPSSGSR